MADLLADLRALLAASAALPEYRADAEAYALHRLAERVTVEGFAPRVKVVRVLTQLAAAEPALAVARVWIDGTSGCADFRGTVVVEDAVGHTHRFAFCWDCRWRAVVERWASPSGAPDQARAASTFGWRCFAEWRALGPAGVRASPPVPTRGPDGDPDRATGV